MPADGEPSLLVTHTRHFSQTDIQPKPSFWRLDRGVLYASIRRRGRIWALPGRTTALPVQLPQRSRPNDFWCHRPTVIRSWKLAPDGSVAWKPHIGALSGQPAVDSAAMRYVPTTTAA